MKTRTFFELVLAGLVTLFVLSCQKDQPFQDEQLPKPVELRTGQNELVFFDRSGVFASTDINDSIQGVVNLRHIDSIHYEGSYTAPFITYLNRPWMKYDITFYSGGNVVKTDYRFAPFRGIAYTQIIGSVEGWDSNVLFIDTKRISGSEQVYFEDECLKNKYSYQYIYREMYVDGTASATFPRLKSGVCNRNNVVYPRTLKQ